MNCRPGDTAIVVRDISGLKSIIGTVVHVCQDIRTNWPEPMGMCASWIIQEPVTITTLRSLRGAGQEYCPPGSVGTLHALPDCILMPLRDQPGEDEILRIAGRPHGVPA